MMSTLKYHGKGRRGGVGFALAALRFYEAINIDAARG